jgi:hypothetical protein
MTQAALLSGVGTNATTGGTVSLTQYSTTPQTASGSSVNFTSIPSWVKRITMQISKVGFAASGSSVVQIGSGSLTTTGYYSYTTYIDSTPSVSVGIPTNGFGTVATGASSATVVSSGVFVITNAGGNIWQYTSQIQRVGDGAIQFGTGSITLGGVLDRLSLVATTSTFNTGTVNIIYE